MTAGIATVAGLLIMAGLVLVVAGGIRRWSPPIRRVRRSGSSAWARLTRRPPGAEGRRRDLVLLGSVLAGVVVASAYGQAFREPLEDLAHDIPVTVIGFREHATWAVQHETISFLDLEDIPGVFREPLPRVSLDNLPDEGAWLQPLRPLTALLGVVGEGRAVGGQHAGEVVVAEPADGDAVGRRHVGQGYVGGPPHDPQLAHGPVPEVLGQPGGRRVVAVRPGGDPDPAGGPEGGAGEAAADALAAGLRGDHQVERRGAGSGQPVHVREPRAPSRPGIDRL